MKKIFSGISIFLLIFLLSACSLFNNETSILDAMIDLDSYSAEVVLYESSLDISVRKHYYKDGEFMILNSNEQQVVYSFEGDENHTIILMEHDFYKFEICDDDLVNVFNFDFLKTMDISLIEEGKYSVDSDFGNLENFSFTIENDLIKTMSFNIIEETYYTFRYVITFDDYNDINFSFEEEPILPTDRQIEFYEFYKEGYIVRVTPDIVKLFGLDHTIVFGLELDTIKLYLVDGYLEIYPSTMDIALVSSQFNIKYSYYDYFRIYSELVISKAKINEIVELYNLFVSE